MYQSSEGRLRRAALVTVVVVGLFLRLYGLNACFSNDEPITYNAAHGSLWAALTTQRYPVANVFAWLSLQIGDGEVLLRLPALSFGMGSIFLMYLLGKRLWGATGGFLAASLLSFSTFHIEHCQNARYYSYLIFATILLLLVAHNYTSSFRWYWLVAWWGSIAAGVLSHPFFLLPVAGFSIGIFLFLCVSKEVRTSKERLASLAYFAGASVIGSACGGLFYISRFYEMVQASVRSDTSEGSSSAIRAGSAHVLEIGQYLAYLVTFTTSLVPGPIALSFILALAGLVLLVRKNVSLAVGTVLSIAVLPLILHFVKVSHWYTVRYFCFALPILAVLVAGGISQTLRSLPGIAKKLPSNKPGGMLRHILVVPEIVIAVCLVGLLGILSVPSVWAYNNRPIDDWREAVNYLAYRMKPTDVLFVGATYYNYNAKERATRPYHSAVLNYYLERLPSTLVPHRIFSGVTTDGFLEVVKKFPKSNIWVIAIEPLLSPDMQSLVVRICGSPVLPGRPSVYLLAEPTVNLLPFGGLEGSVTGIRLSQNASIVECDLATGNHAVYIHNEVPDTSHSVRFPVSLERGSVKPTSLETGMIYTLSCFIRLANVQQGGNWSRACKVVLDGKRNDERGLWHELILLRGTQDWTFYAFQLTQGETFPANATDIGIRVGLFGGTGEVWVDNVQLEAKPYPTAFVQGGRPPHDEVLANLGLLR